MEKYSLQRIPYCGLDRHQNPIFQGRNIFQRWISHKRHDRAIFTMEH